MLLADDFFCIAHDDRTGRSRLNPRVLGLGLAGALLGELVLFRRIVISEGVIVLARREPPPDPLAHATLAQLIASPQHNDLQTWLAVLAETATDAVGKRLVQAGVVQPGERHWLWRAQVSYPPVDVNAVAWRPIRLAGLLTSAEEVKAPDVVLAQLVAATGLSKRVLWQPEFREAGLARLSAELLRLDGSLTQLLAFVEAAVGSAVLAPR